MYLTKTIDYKNVFILMTMQCYNLACFSILTAQFNSSNVKLITIIITPKLPL